jgi:hypothetical protein
MAALDTTQLKNLATLDFSTFKALAWQGQNRADAYYTALGIEAEKAGLLHVQNYATLAGHVVNNDSLNGAFGNYFTAAAAEKEHVDFSAGSEARLRMQYELMQADIQFRRDDTKTTTGELNFAQTNEIHKIALEKIGLPPEAYFFYTPLATTAEADPARAQFMFQTALSGNGILDTLEDGVLVGFGAEISSQQELSEILRDYAAQAKWLETATEAMQDMVANYPGDVSAINDKLEIYQGILSLAGGTFDVLADWADKLANLPEWEELLPTWLLPVVGMQDSRGTVITGGGGGWYCPLILDLDGDGAHSVNLGWVENRSRVYFDMDNDGYAERTAWVAAGDGLLAIDKNGNGKIDSQGELFGNGAGFADGFANLKQYDSNADNKITAADAQFANLRVWTDADSDGVTDAGELKTLASLNITQINLAATALTNVLDNENKVSATSTFVMNGQSREIADHWFRIDQADTQYMGANDNFGWVKSRVA